MVDSKTSFSGVKVKGPNVSHHQATKQQSLLIAGLTIHYVILFTLINLCLTLLHAHISETDMCWQTKSVFEFLGIRLNDQLSQTFNAVVIVIYGDVWW